MSKCMSTVVTTQVPARAVSLPLSRLDRIPWYTWMSVLAAASIMFGLYWDISWHETIGRDTFWTPAHLLIQFGAVLAGIYSAYLIFSTTFASDRSARSSSVRVLGFYGPLGAFICAWGGVAMITSAPFDNWWHEAYGLDVKIVSPPHTLLAMGFAAIMWGSITLISGQMNRSSTPQFCLLHISIILGSARRFTATRFTTGRTMTHPEALPCWNWPGFWLQNQNHGVA